LIDLPRSPKVLLVGYREDTYDAQGLTELGYHPQVEYLDINPAPKEEILRRDSFKSFKIAKRDAKYMGEKIAADSLRPDLLLKGLPRRFRVAGCTENSRGCQAISKNSSHCSHPIDILGQYKGASRINPR